MKFKYVNSSPFNTFNNNNPTQDLNNKFNNTIALQCNTSNTFKNPATLKRRRLQLHQVIKIEQVIQLLSSAPQAPPPEPVAQTAAPAIAPAPADYSNSGAKTTHYKNQEASSYRRA